MTVTRLHGALLTVLAAVTCGFAAELPSTAESLLLDRLHAKKIVEVHAVRRRTIGDFDYLGLFATFEVNSSFESWYHPEVILRKRRSGADWSQAELFQSRRRVIDLFGLPDNEFEKALTPW